jgi:hypothetical protein
MTPEDSNAPEPLAFYADEHSRNAAQASLWQSRESRVSHGRLAVFLLLLACGWLAFGSHQIEAYWTLLPLLAFLGLILLHDRLIERRRRTERISEFFARGLDRIRGDWVGKGNAGEEFCDPDHPYSNDLDVFGRGSLFELLCTVRTAAGESMLADWLLKPASGEVARQRQTAVQELASRLDLRRDISLLGEEVGSGISSEHLVDWGGLESRLPSRILPWIAAALTSLTAISAIALFLTDIGAIPLLFSALLQSVFALTLRSRVKAVLEAAEAPTHDLEVLSGLLARIEVEDMDAERLRILRAALHRGDALPSRRIDQLRTMRDLLEARRNQFFAPIGWLLLWGTQLACALERWRAHSGATLGPWIDAAAEIEVLCALSGYAFEHPDDIFPELLDADPIFEGEALGHPLIPADDCVCNDLALGSERRALVMSGSNMSGKSTMLRTVGCAVILALAGAPVRAGRLRLSPLQIAASIRISDSLQQGASHFFAEITRLRQVVDLTEGEVPVLFLLDEVLHGTNSHDRRIGAEAVLRGLIDRGALGIVTTHDLALAEIADAEDLGLANVHFEDRIEAGRMFFDFRLRPGIVTRSNAIELMRSVGLDV